MSIPWVKDGHLFLRNDEQRDRNWGGGLSTWQKKSYVWIDSGKNWNYVVIGHFCLFFCLGKSFIWMGHNQFSWTCPNSEMIHKRSQGPPAPAQCHVSARKSRANWGTMMINQPLNKGQLCLPSLKLTSSLPSWKMYGWKMMRFPFWENPPFSGQKSEMALSSQRSGYLICSLSWGVEESLLKFPSEWGISEKQNLAPLGVCITKSRTKKRISPIVTSSCMEWECSRLRMIVSKK